jgi:hypothetical protein
MDPVLIILSEIISYEGSSMSQCMGRLTMPDGVGGPSVQGLRPASSQTQQSSMRMMTLGGRCFGARPPARVPSNNC